MPFCWFCHEAALLEIPYCFSQNILPVISVCLTHTDYERNDRIISVKIVLFDFIQLDVNLQQDLS